ncbi:MAG: hydantoinase/oxoprolinase family protein [Gemmatimonadota bacterium]
MSTSLLAIDTGGTFTDLLLFHEGSLTALKLPSTPADPAEAVLAGIRRILAERAAEELLLSGDLEIVHGSTAATNALLERKGARVFLVTNSGFEDVLEIGRQDRPQLYALVGHRPPPLVDRDHRLGVSGRLGADGSEIEPLDPDELAALPPRLSAAESVAVVLLHSYANPMHEEAVGLALEPISVPLSISSKILPEFREFERTSTTVANAYIAPLMRRYLERLARETGGGRIRIMGSNGGALPLARAATEPVHTILSGPAGGVVAALEWGRRCGKERLLSFDMGGTSTDVSLIPGSLLHTREGRVGGIPIAIPLLDIHTVGAGGGSIARVDPGGALRVGPESAGAVPGPIAYGDGGAEVTVTDAHLWLGRLPSASLAGGRRLLDRTAVAAPLAELAREAGTSPDQVAEGVVEVANTAMEGALRVISVERGVDVSDFTLVAFGGAAGLHAAELADRLGVEGVLVPPAPGLFSAFGMLVAPNLRERQRTVLVSSEESGSGEEVERILAELEEGAMEEMLREGAPRDRLTSRRWVDARYRDQSFELRVPAVQWATRFQEAHEARYGYRREGVLVEAVTLRVQVESPGAEIATATLREPETAAGAAHTTVFWRGEKIEAAVVARGSLEEDRAIAGPAIVTEYSATTWCPPGWRIRRDTLGALHLSRN